MSQRPPRPVAPRTRALASAIAQRLYLPDYDEARYDQLAHQVSLALMTQGYRIYKDDDLVDQYRAQKADHTQLLHDAHATICLLLERLGGEVELAPDELARTAASRFSIVTVPREDGTTALAAYRPL